MIDSLLEDIKGQLRHGNMVIRLILINVFIFIIFTFIGVFTPGGTASASYHTLEGYFALPADTSVLLKRPWTIFTHMFLHDGFGHIFWNMLIFYWFGRIVGDLLGDKRILPLYFAGGLAGAVFYLFFANFLSPYGGIAMGASAAVMGIVVASGFLAPHYRLHLILIGEVKLMYVVAAFFLIDIVMISGNSNTGGHFAHLGGSFLGGFYIYYMHKTGIDFLSLLTGIFEKPPEKTRSPRSAKVVSIKNEPIRRSHSSSVTQDSVDRILEKIKISGVSSLSKEEKDVLDRASKE